MLDGIGQGGICMATYRVGVKESDPSISYEPHSINLNREDLRKYMNE